MSNLPEKTAKVPPWVWLSMLPAFGGLAIVYGARNLNNKLWTGLGIGVTFLALRLQSTELAIWIWLSQIALAFWLNHQLSPPPLPKIREEIGVDINICSKHDLVYRLEMPIVYANDIESLRNEGYIFTYLEELSEIAGLPENYLRKIAPLVTFSYDPHREVHSSWRRMNSYTREELIRDGLEPVVAEQIFSERQAKGLYRSAYDISKRTGLPLRSFENLL